MANTLTDLLPNAYAGLDVVSREQVGFIRAVSLGAGIERVAVGQNLVIPIAPAVSLGDNTAAVNAPDTGDSVMTNVTATITRSKHAPVRINGEETLGLKNAGNYDMVMQGRFAQAFRALVNHIETDIASLYTKASRAYGTAGTAPFGTAANLTHLSNMHLILDDNGAPTTDRQLVLSNAAINNLRGVQSSLFKVNEAGTDELLRRGTVGALEGFDVHQSGQVALHTKGTGANYLSDHATYAIGDSALHVDTGTGTLVAGDAVTFTGDSNIYLVTTGFAGDGDMDLVLAQPGLRATLANDVAMTVGNGYRANMAFSRSAIALGTRLPALPEQGDSAVDRTTITDPISGITFELAMYNQYRQVHIEVALAWGYQVIKPAHCAVLFG